MTSSSGAPWADLFDRARADERVGMWHEAEQGGYLPYFQTLYGEVGQRMRFRDREVVILGSNNYMGLTNDPRVKQAAIEATERYGTGLTGSRFMNGTIPIHAELEEFLADWVGAEAALVFATGYLANLGLVAGLVGAGDAVFLDSAAHASLVDGTKFSDGMLRAFRHNRPNSLRRGLRSWRQDPDAGALLVAVDGIYSMEGDVAPLKELSVLSQEFGARLLVDEAHSLGVMGPGGAGAAAEAGIEADLIMGTFSKSLSSCGGFVAGPADVIGHLRIVCRPLIFTASGVPAALGAAMAAARIARTEDWRRESLVARSAQLRAGLLDLGYEVGGDPRSPVVPVVIGDDLGAVDLWKRLTEEGVYTNCAVAPAVNKATLRTSVMATHTEEDIADALGAFERTRRGAVTDG